MDEEWSYLLMTKDDYGSRLAFTIFVEPSSPVVKTL